MSAKHLCHPCLVEGFRVRARLALRRTRKLKLRPVKSEVIAANLLRAACPLWQQRISLPWRSPVYGPGHADVLGGEFNQGVCAFLGARPSIALRIDFIIVP